MAERHSLEDDMPASPTTVWKSAEDALIAGDARELERLLREHEELFRTGQPPAYNAGGLAPDYAGGDAQAIIARNHDFENWDQFAAHLRALAQPNSPVARFEAAVDAIVNGDAATLARLLKDDPALVRARSARQHHATLLNYVGANGVESHRQRTPHNAVAIARMLLDAGAEIDATGDMYGGTTTLGLVATSIHPLQAGVQNALIAFLIERGASLDRAVAPDYRNGNLIDSCLANARPEAAAFLAEHGAPLTLTGAAGAGRLDAVEPFFDETGRPKPGVSQHELLEALGWASTYGRRSSSSCCATASTPRRSCPAICTRRCTPPQWAATPTSSNCCWIAMCRSRRWTAPTRTRRSAGRSTDGRWRRPAIASGSMRSRGCSSTPAPP